MGWGSGCQDVGVGRRLSLRTSLCLRISSHVSGSEVNTVTIKQFNVFYADSFILSQNSACSCVLYPVPPLPLSLGRANHRGALCGWCERHLHEGRGRQLRVHGLLREWKGLAFVTFALWYILGLLLPLKKQDVFKLGALSPQGTHR